MNFSIYYVYMENKPVEHINCDLNVGLTSEQVELRRKDGLVNKIQKHVTKSVWKIIRDNVLNFFNIFLFVIAAAMFVAQLPITYFGFLFIITANILIGIIQDIRARQLVKKLRIVSYPYVNVLRDKEESKVLGNELVLSDIVLLKAGDQIIVDSTVMEGSIEVNESMLTGESVNVLKQVGDVIYSGSYVVSGTAKTRVDKLGKENYAEQLQIKAKHTKKRASEILNAFHKIFNFLSILVSAIALVLVISYILEGKFNTYEGYSSSMQYISGALVTMLPTGMFLLTSATLTVGVIQLAKKRMLVQELYSIEMLARVDVLCFDKTGTLTDGSMIVNSLVPQQNYDKHEIEKILHTLVTSTNDTNATANALLEAYKATPILHYHSCVPFNSERKYSAVMLEDGRSFVLGAREFLPHKDKNIDELCATYESQGLRVMLLGLSKKVINPKEKLGILEPVCIVVLEDHIRDDAAKNISWFKENGVAIKIISGDNPVSVSAISSRVGVENADKYISLEGMSIEEVKAIADQYTIFGRVSPEQKEAIVHALQEKGHKVGMTGDGVNDILALKAADCSIAMASGSEAAQNVSHLVTMDSNFSSLPDVVSQGRRVINNLQRTCSLFLVKTLFAIILTIFFIVTSFVNPEFAYPFKTSHMYVWEFCTIGMASLFLSFQPNTEQLSKSRFFQNIITRTIPAGLLQALICVIFFLLALSGVISIDVARVCSVITFSVTSFVILVRICMPFDIYRVMVIIVFGVICFSMFIADRFIPSSSEYSLVLQINYGILNASNWWYILIGVCSYIPAYIGVETIAVRISHKITLKGENK